MNMLPVNETKVIDRTIDVYLWVSEDLNTDEVKLLGQRLIDLAERRATDIEQVYIDHRCPKEDKFQTIEGNKLALV